MSGVILATAIGGAAVSTGAVVAAGIGAGTTLYGGAKSFSDANKARKRGEAAERAADKAIEEAKRRVDVNAYEQLSIAKEPYELMRDALLTQGATGMQAGVEGETRGAAATAGRMQMAQNLRQGEVRGEMGQRMDEINKLVAGEDKRRQLQLAGIAMEETAGAQLAVRDAEEDRAAYIAQGVGTLGGIAEGLSSSYAEGNFGQGRRYTPDGLANTAETIRAGDLGQNRGYELADGSVLNPNIDPDAYAAFGGTVPTGLEADAQVRQGRRAARQFARQDRRAANDIQRAQAQNQRALNRLEGQPFLPPGAATPSPMQPRMVQSSVNSPVLQPLAGPQARIVPQAGTTRTSGPLDPFDPFGGGGFTPPSPVNATRAEARASVAPAGVGGPLQSMPPRQVDSQTPTAELQGSRSQRPVAPTFGGGSYYNGKGNNEQASVEDLVKILKKEEGLTDAEVEIAKKRFKVEPDGSVGFSMPPSELEDEYFNRESAGSRAGVQSVGETETARDLLERLAGKESQEVVAPDPTPKQVEEVTTKSVESAASVGPATEEVVRRVTENANPDNPLPIAMQWLDVKELDPEGVELRSTLWSTIHGKADTTAMVDDNWAWCAALVNHTLTEAGADTLVTDDPYDKGRAKAYETFGKSVEGSNTKTMLGNAKPGDIVVKKKMVPERDKNGKLTGRMKVQYHVGFFSGYDAENGTVNLLGGNQNDEVNITAYPIEQVTAVRRIRVDALTDEEKESMSKIMIKQEGGTR
jgi:uncharacterized protein (TIGR02594 family)